MSSEKIEDVVVSFKINVMFKRDFIRRFNISMKVFAFVLLFPFGVFSQSVNPQDVRYVFQNTSGLNQLQYADDDIYIAAIGRSNNVGGGGGVFLDNLNTTNPNLVVMSPAYNTMVGPDGGMYGDVFTRLSDLPIDANGDRYIDIPPMFGAQIWIGLGEPMYVPLQVESYAGADIHNPSSPNFNNKFEIIEFTQTDADRIISNTTRVDVYQYPMGQEVYGPNGEYIKVGETATHEQVLAKYKLFVDDPFLSTIDEEKGIIHQPTTVPEFQTGGAQANYFDAYIDQVWAAYSTRTLQAEWGGVVHTATVQGNQLVWDNGERTDKPTTAEVVGGTGPLNNGYGQILGVVLNRGALDLNNLGVQVWDDEANYYSTTPKNDYTHFFHSDLVSFESQTYAFAYDDVFDHSSTSTMDNAEKVVISIGGFGIEHTQELTDVYIDPPSVTIDEFQTFQLNVKGLDQALFDMELPVNANITWTVQGDNSLIGENGLFGPADIGVYTINVEVEVDGVVFNSTSSVEVEPEGSSGQICVGEVNDYSDYRIETRHDRVYITFVPRNNFNGNGWIRLFYERANGTGNQAYDVQENQEFELYGVFSGSSLDFNYLYQAASPPQIQSPVFTIPNVGTCDGLQVEEYLTRIEIVEQNVTLDEGDYVDLSVIGISNEGNDIALSGPIVWSGEGVDQNGNFVGTTPGVYVIKATVDGIVHQTTITVNSTTCVVSVDITGNDAVCAGENLVLGLSLSNLVSFNWSGDGATKLNDGNSEIPTFMSLESGAFELTVTIEDVNGCVGTGAKEITVNELPVSDVSSNTLESCIDADPFELVANYVGGVFTGEGVVVDDFHSSDVSNVNTPITITYNYTDPLTACIADEVEFDITVHETAAPSGGNLIAFSEDITNQALVPDLCVVGSSIKWYGLPNKGGLLANTANCINTSFVDASPVDGFMDEGEYLFYVTQTQNGCESTPLEIGLTVQNKCAVTVTLSGETALCDGDSIDVVVTAEDFISLDWSGTGDAFLKPTLDPLTFRFLGTQSGDFSISLEVEDVNGCIGSASNSITVHSIPVADISMNTMSICIDADSIDLLASPQGGVFSGVGVLNNKFSPNGITNASSAVFYNYVDALTTCSAEEVMFDISINTTDSIEVDDVYAFNQTVSDQGTVPDLCGVGTNLNWYSSKDKNGGVIGASNCYVPQFIDLNNDGLMDVGSYSYYITQTVNSCESVATEVVLIVEECSLISTIDYTTNSNIIFENDTLKLCDLGVDAELTLTTNRPLTVNEWRNTSTVTPLAIEVVSYSTNQSGDYYVIVKDEDFPAQCFVSSDTIHLSSIQPLEPTVLIAIDENDVCDNETQRITVDVTNQGDSPNYKWFVNSVEQEVDGSVFESSELSNGDDVYVELLSSLSCVSVNNVPSNSIAIFKKPLLDPKASVASRTLCAGDEVSFELSDTVDLGNSYSIEWKLNGSVISSDFDSGDISVQSGDVLDVSIGDLPECSTPNEIDVTVSIDIVEPILPTIIALVTELCEGQATSVSTDISEGLSWYRNDQSITTEKVLVIDEAGWYKVSYEDGVCPIQFSDSIEIVVYSQPTIDLGKNRTLLLGETTYLAPSLNEYTNLEWFSRNEILDPFALDQNIQPINSGYYILNVQNGACYASDSIYVKVEMPFSVPNAFSPNGDQINDTWEIVGVDEYPNAHLTVFNRWGAIIFQQYNGIVDFWDGANYPIGTYYYALVLGDSEASLAGETITGAVTITK